MDVHAPAPHTRSEHLIHGGTNRKISKNQMLAGLVCTVAVAVAAYLVVDNYRVYLIAGGMIFSGFALVMSISFLVTLMYMKRESGIEEDLLLAHPSGPAQESFAVLIPARHETEVLPTTLLNTAWTQRDHTDHQIFAIVNDDDPDTARVAITTAKVVNTAMSKGTGLADIDRQLAARLGAPGFGCGSKAIETLVESIPDGPLNVIVYPLGLRKPNKPQQLNYAFWQLGERFTVFTVLDAESIAANGLLSAVDQAFQDNPEVEIIQGGIQLMDPKYSGSFLHRVGQRIQRWYSWHNLLEYTRWFSSQMRYQSDRGFMPLGGNTVFLRSELLTKTGGWPMSLTEDCELGVRATAIHGAKTLTFYDPALTTREETPPNLATLVKQRRRWNIGFIQSFVAGNWRALPTLSQRLTALWILTMCLFQTAAFAVLPLTLATIFWIKSPAPLAVAMCIPTIPIILAVALQMLHIREFGKAFDRPIRWHVYVLFVLTFYPYQVVLSYAAAQAVVWYALGKMGWDKTTHVGDHFHSPAADLRPGGTLTAAGPA